jgi:hypothetical protein
MKLIMAWLARIMGKGRRVSTGRILLVFSLLLPATALIFVVLRNYVDESTESLLKSKLSQARLAAAIVEEKLNSTVALGRSYASRPLLIKCIEENQWDKALKILSEIVIINPGFERFVLYDTNAVIRADLPFANVIGQNRRDKEWFKEFRKEWKPLVSGVYQRGAEPKKNVVCIILPILEGPVILPEISPPQPRASRKIGILQLQLDLSYFHSWANLDVGKGGIMYIVDQYGRIVHHPLIEDHINIIDFSSIGVVKKALAGENGVAQNYNSLEHEERLAGFYGIPKYGWGVIVTQPVRFAFEQRNATLRTLAIACCLLLCLTFALVYTVTRIFIFQQKSTETLNKKNAELQQANVDLHIALENIKTLKGLLPICSHCKKIRDDSGYWEQIESYVKNHSDAEFTHGICPDCIKKYFPAFAEKITNSSVKAR